MHARRHNRIYGRQIVALILSPTGDAQPANCFKISFPNFCVSPKNF